MLHFILLFSSVAQVMNESIERGLHTDGILPGGLNVRRRASAMREKLEKRKRTATPTDWMRWVNCFSCFFLLMFLWSAYAIAVNEENAAGGRVVTAPTNGAAGIIPAVLRHCIETTDDWSDRQTVEFLSVAAVIGMIYKHGASISAAEVGCQGEVGVACSMAAGAVCHVQGGTIEQIEDAAEVRNRICFSLF
jgi:L-serine dehydratase